MTFSLNTSAIVEALQTAGRAHGLEIPSNIEPGVITRFSTGKNDHNGWVAFFPNNMNGTAGATFGDWKTGIKQNWFYSPNGSKISQEEMVSFNLQLEAVRLAADLERKALQAQAAVKAKERWDQAQPADPMHLYLVKKQVEPYGIRQDGDRLLIPAKV